MRTAEGRLCLFVAIDRTSKFAFARLHERATRRVAADFLRALVAAAPHTIHTIHTVLTDNGTRFVDSSPVDEAADAEAEAIWAARGEPRICRVHAFARACEQDGIEHRLTSRVIPGPTVKSRG